MKRATECGACVNGARLLRQPSIRSLGMSLMIGDPKHVSSSAISSSHRPGSFFERCEDLVLEQRLRWSMAAKKIPVEIKPGFRRSTGQAREGPTVTQGLAIIHRVGRSSLLSGFERAPTAPRHCLSCRLRSVGSDVCHQHMSYTIRGYVGVHKRTCIHDLQRLVDKFHIPHQAVANFWLAR